MFCISCKNEDDTTPVLIFLKSGSVSQTLEAGKKALYEIETYSNQANLNRLTITSFSVEDGERILIDSVLNVQKINYPFIYQAPEFADDSISVVLKIAVSDTKNNTQELKCSIKVVKGLYHLLPEMTGIVLYSGSSGRPDAFSLNDPSHVFLKALADSTDIDVFDYVADSSTDQLSREWRTNTDVRFAKVNSLNYSLVTAQSLRNIYAAVIRQKYVNAIQAGDIIILGRENQVAGVIQIVYVADEEGSLNDYYFFNIKMIK